VKAKTAASNTLLALVVTAPEPLRAQLREQSGTTSTSTPADTGAGPRTALWLGGGLVIAGLLLLALPRRRRG
jgi:hypothetical protein